MIKTILDNLPLFIAAAVLLVVALVDGIAKESPTLIPQIIDGLMKMIEDYYSAITSVDRVWHKATGGTDSGAR